MNERIFGMAWEEIQARQEGTYVAPKIDLSKSGKPEATAEDRAMLDDKGAEWIETQGLYGILDRLKTSGLI